MHAFDTATLRRENSSFCRVFVRVCAHEGEVGSGLVHSCYFAVFVGCPVVYYMRSFTFPLSLSLSLLSHYLSLLFTNNFIIIITNIFCYLSGDLYTIYKTCIWYNYILWTLTMLLWFSCSLIIAIIGFNWYIHI